LSCEDLKEGGCIEMLPRSHNSNMCKNEVKGSDGYRSTVRIGVFFFAN